MQKTEFLRRVTNGHTSKIGVLDKGYEVEAPSAGGGIWQMIIAKSFTGNWWDITEKKTGSLITYNKFYTRKQAMEELASCIEMLDDRKIYPDGVSSEWMDESEVITRDEWLRMI